MPRKSQRAILEAHVRSIRRVETREERMRRGREDARRWSDALDREIRYQSGRAKFPVKDPNAVRVSRGGPPQSM